jgi:Glycosyltransferase family 87
VLGTGSPRGAASSRWVDRLRLTARSDPLASGAIAGNATWTSASRRFRPSDGRVAAVNHALLVLPLLFTGWLFANCYSAHDIAVDFHHDFWVAGYRVMHGVSPYAWTRHQISELVGFPYPAPAALLFVPFSLLPRGAADLVFVAVLMVACLSSLWIVRVRDWRLYAVALFWSPVVNGWQTANVTLLLVCGLALVWRHRNSPAVAGGLTAVMLAVKPVAWPLVLWLLVTRRFRTATYAVGVALVMNLVAWTVIGFGQLGAWWHLLSVQAGVMYRQGYGLIALAAHLGAGRTVGTALLVVATTGVAAACVRVGRRGRDQQALTLAVALMLVASPLVDNHYFALLIVPLAIARPYLSPAWLLPLALWLCPATGVAGWEAALAWVTFGAMISWLASDRLTLRAIAAWVSTRDPRSPIEPRQRGWGAGV